MLSFAMIFVLYVTPEYDGLLQESLTRAYPAKHLKVTPGLYFVSGGNATTKDVSDALGISDGPINYGLVATIGSYYGRLPSHVWEWLSKNWQ